MALSGIERSCRVLGNLSIEASWGPSIETSMLVFRKLNIYSMTRRFNQSEKLIQEFDGQYMQAVISTAGL